MSEPKWTPGPWEFRFIFRMFRTLRNHQTTLGLMLQPDDTRDAADAHLMAAAPDLYRALSDMVDWATDKPLSYIAWDALHGKALAILAKARGGYFGDSRRIGGTGGDAMSIKSAKTGNQKEQAHGVSAAQAREEIRSAIVFYDELGACWLGVVTFIGIRALFGGWGDLLRSLRTPLRERTKPQRSEER